MIASLRSAATSSSAEAQQVAVDVSVVFAELRTECPDGARRLGELREDTLHGEVAEHFVFEPDDRLARLEVRVL